MDTASDAPVPETAPRRTLALYRSLDTGIEIVSGEGTDRHCRQYIRVSGFVHVPFPALTPDEVRMNLARLEAALADSDKQHEHVVASLRAARDQLLALIEVPHQEGRP